jgi:hypothetical protein
MHKLFQAALHFYHLDIPVMLQLPGVKDPMFCPYKVHLTHEILDALNQEEPRFNICLLTDDVHRFVVMDVDTARNGQRDLDWLENTFGPLPDTLINNTSKDGKHIYFRLKQTDPVIPTLGGHNAGWLEGIDLISEKGTATIPPSVHPCGHHYFWTYQGQPIDLPALDMIAPCPEWLINPESGVLNFTRHNNPAINRFHYRTHIDFQFPEAPKTEAEKPFVETLICIPLGSDPKYESAKTACLETWLSDIKALPDSQCQYFFVMSDPDLEIPVLEDDVLKVPCEDGYFYRIQEKIQSFTQWALAHFRFNHIFKCDPDSFLFTPQWLKVIEAHAHQDLIGYPYWEVNDDVAYPCGGGGYLYSHKAAQVLSKAKLGRYGPEERDIASILFYQGNIPLTACNRLSQGEHSGSHITDAHQQHLLASTHYVKPEEMYSIYDKFKQASKNLQSIQAEAIHPDWRSTIYFFSTGNVGRDVTGFVEGTWEFLPPPSSQPPSQTLPKLTIHWKEWPSESWGFQADGKTAIHEAIGEASQILFSEPFQGLNAFK